MADFGIDVVIDPKQARDGSKQIETALEQLAAAANALNAQLNKALRIDPSTAILDLGKCRSFSR